MDGIYSLLVLQNKYNRKEGRKGYIERGITKPLLLGFPKRMEIVSGSHQPKDTSSMDKQNIIVGRELRVIGILGYFILQCIEGLSRVRLNILEEEEDKDKRK